MKRYRTIRFPLAIKEKLLDIRSQAQNLFNNYKNKYQFVCRKGCADCCVVFPWHLIEAAYICYRLNRNPSLFDPNVLAKHINKLDKIFEERKISLTHKEAPLLYLRSRKEASYFYDILSDQRCPFLAKDNSCVIYDYRPIICIMFGSKNKSSCKGDSRDAFLSTQERLYDYHLQKIARKLESLSKRFLGTFCPEFLRFKPKLIMPINRWIEVKDKKILLCLPGVRIEILP